MPMDDYDFNHTTVYNNTEILNIYINDSDEIIHEKIEQFLSSQLVIVKHKQESYKYIKQKITELRNCFCILDIRTITNLGSRIRVFTQSDNKGVYDFDSKWCLLVVWRGNN